MLHVLVHAHCAADNILTLPLNNYQIGRSHTAVSLCQIIEQMRSDFHTADKKCKQGFATMQDL